MLDAGIEPPARDGGGAIEPPDDDADAGVDAAQSCDPRRGRFDEPTPFIRTAFVLHLAGSNQFVDPYGRRVGALHAMTTSLGIDPFSATTTFGYGGGVYGDGVFRPARDFVQPSWVNETSTLADLQGGLARLRQALLHDATALTDAARVRTVYIVLIMSPGSRSPICCALGEESIGALGEVDANCPADAYPQPEPDVTYCEGTWMNMLCRDETALANLRASLADTDAMEGEALAGLVVGQDYNRPAQLTGAVAQMRAELLALGVRDFRLHLGHLSDPDLDPDLAVQLGLRDCSFTSLMRALANAGNGNYRILDTRAALEIEALFNACPLSLDETD